MYLHASLVTTLIPHALVRYGCIFALHAFRCIPHISYRLLRTYCPHTGMVDVLPPGWDCCPAHTTLPEHLLHFGNLTYHTSLPRFTCCLPRHAVRTRCHDVTHGLAGSTFVVSSSMGVVEHLPHHGSRSPHTVADGLRHAVVRSSPPAPLQPTLPTRRAKICCRTAHLSRRAADMFNSDGCATNICCYSAFLLPTRADLFLRARYDALFPDVTTYFVVILPLPHMVLLSSIRFYSFIFVCVQPIRYRRH